MAAGRARVDLKTKLLTAFVVVTNVLGNFSMSWGMKHQAADLGWAPAAYIRLIFTPWVLLGTALLILWLLSRMTLLGWADLSLSLIHIWSFWLQPLALLSLLVSPNLLRCRSRRW